jgi:hypothetical protein
MNVGIVCLLITTEIFSNYLATFINRLDYVTPKIEKKCDYEWRIRKPIEGTREQESGKSIDDPRLEPRTYLIWSTNAVH